MASLTQLVASFIRLALSLIIITFDGALSQNLDSLIALSGFLDSNPRTSTSGNVNIVSTGDYHDESIAVCYMPYLFSFSRDGIPWNIIGSYDGLAAISLAMEHLNTGNGTIIQQLDGIHERCPLRFVTKAFDAESEERIAVNHVITLTDRDSYGQGSSRLLPCAILGAAYSSISIPTSIISSIRGFPQISPISTSTTLDDKSQHKLFGRTNPNDEGRAISLVEKLKSWNVNYIAIVYIDDPYGNSFAKAVRRAIQRNAPDIQVKTVYISVDANDDIISDVIQELKEMGYTYFFGILFPAKNFDRVMTEAYNQGIAGTGRHTWLFSDVADKIVSGRNFTVGSTLEKAFRGTGTLSFVGGGPGMELFDKLASSIQQLGESEKDRSYLDAHLPRDYSEGKFVNHSIITEEDTYLKEPGPIVPFLYDAVVGLGLASCGLIETSKNHEYFTGEQLYQAFLNTTFEGTSGSVVLDPETGTRDPHTAIFVMKNFVYDEDSSGQGLVQFKEVESDIFMAGEWEQLTPYIFNDGTSTIPLDLPFLETKPNHLSTGLRVVGSILCGIIIALAIGFGFWTYHNSRKRVVRASQPIFLYIISAGTLLMGLAIIPLTIDLRVTDQKGADAACMAVPWLLAVGFSLTFSALFTKTYRINQLMGSAARFKRLTVTATDVVKPMIILLILNFIVLIVWTMVDPRQRTLVVVTKDPFGRNEETYGMCSSDHPVIFATILCVINLGSLLFALLQAYRARNISTEFQESNYIFMAMTLVLLASFIGIPVMIIAQDNTAAYYFVAAGLLFVVCASVLLLVFVPKCRALRSEESASNRRYTVADGIQILNTDMAQNELARENDELRQENLRLKSRVTNIHDARSELEKDKNQIIGESQSKLKWMSWIEMKGRAFSERRNSRESVNSNSEPIVHHPDRVDAKDIVEGIKDIGFGAEPSWHSAVEHINPPDNSTKEGQSLYVGDHRL